MTTKHRKPRNPAPHNEPRAPEPYATLAEFRTLIRRFLAFSETAASAAGLTPRHHQALLAIKGAARPTTVGELAERLVIRHHSAVELADRLVETGLIHREHDTQDKRRILLTLTDSAEQHLSDLSAAHVDELRRLRPTLVSILDRLPPS